MKRIFETRQEGRSFLENLGVRFEEDGSIVFPDQPNGKTAQNFTMAAQQLAFEIYQSGRVTAELFGPIEAILTVWRRKKPLERLTRGPKGYFHPREEYPPTLLSQFTAELGPLIYREERGGFGKLIRMFAEYDERGLNCYGEKKLLAGKRTLIVVDREGPSEEDFDIIERTARFFLGETIQGDYLKPTEEELQNLVLMEAAMHDDYLSDCRVRKRARLLAGGVAMVSTISAEALEVQMEKWLEFIPDCYTLCDYAPVVKAKSAETETVKSEEAIEYANPEDDPTYPEVS